MKLSICLVALLISFSFLVNAQQDSVSKNPASNNITSPEPFESNYQTALKSANSSKERANALMAYVNGLLSTTLTQEQNEALGKEKVKQLSEIDFYAVHEFKMLGFAKGIPLEKTRFVFKLLRDTLSTDQFAILDFYLKEMVHKPGVQIYNQTTGVTETITKELDWPSNAPRPGYGWGKLVSSNKPGNNGGEYVAQPSVKPTPTPVDELSLLRSNAAAIQGSTVFLENTIYKAPSQINISSLDDEITLTAIGSHYTYSSYYNRSIFGTRLLNGITKRIKVKELIRRIDNVSGAYLVTEVGPCKSCSGQGSSWDNSSRKRTNCSHCNATGCVPTLIWNNGASRPY